ncbi:MAG: hypothetical protein ACPG7U_01625 [Holosporaceae bacterium]
MGKLYVVRMFLLPERLINAFFGVVCGALCWGGVSTCWLQGGNDELFLNERAWGRKRLLEASVEGSAVPQEGPTVKKKNPLGVSLHSSLSCVEEETAALQCLEKKRCLQVVPMRRLPTLCHDLSRDTFRQTDVPFLLRLPNELLSKICLLLLGVPIAFDKGRPVFNASSFQKLCDLRAVNKRLRQVVDHLLIQVKHVRDAHFLCTSHLGYMCAALYQQKPLGLPKSHEIKLNLSIANTKRFDRFVQHIRRMPYLTDCIEKIQLFHAYVTAAHLALLRNLRTASLFHCPSVSTAFGLQHVTSLSLIGCDGVQTIENIPLLRQLVVRFCNSLLYIAHMPALCDVTVEACQRLVLAYNLPKLHRASFSTCPLLTNLGDLPSLRTCRVILCDIFCHIGPLNDLESLYINACDCFEVLTPENVPSLTLLEMMGCQQVKQVSGLAHLKHLRLLHCHNLTDLCSLPCLTSLYMNSCHALKSVSGLPLLRTLKVIGCNDLETVHTLPQLHALFVDHCAHMRTLENLPLLEHLLINTLCKKKTVASIRLWEGGTILALQSRGVCSEDLLTVHALESGKTRIQAHQSETMQSIQGLSSLRTLVACYMPRLTFIADLPALMCVMLQSCPQLKTVARVGPVPFVAVAGMRSKRLQSLLKRGSFHDV